MNRLTITLLILMHFVTIACATESVSSISFVYVPPYGSFENLQGATLNANPDEFAVAVYIMVDGQWWTKPYWDSPITKISDDGTWICDITTGGVDETASIITAYLISKDYESPSASGTFQLSQELEKRAVARAVIKRGRLDKLSVFEPEAKSIVKLKGICYGPFRDNENPDMGIFPLLGELDQDLGFIPQITKVIRTYGCAETLSKIPFLCEKFGIDCYLGAWLGKYKIENKKEIESIVDLANQNIRSVKGLIIGNEVLLRKDLTEQELINRIKEVRKTTKIPITTAEVWSTWLEHPQLANEVDFLIVHIHPYWDGISIERAAVYVAATWQRLKEFFPNKRIIIGETGWPSDGKTVDSALPSKRNQAKFFKEFIEIARAKEIEYFYFELFDEKWKDKFEGKAGAHWGIYNSDGSLKDHFKDLIPIQARKGINRPPREVLPVVVTVPLVVYKDAGSKENSFQPSGWMGDIECIELDRACETNPYSGKTCVRITYKPDLFLSQRWSGIYWQYPLNNWGDYPGYELSGATKLTFWARGEKGDERAEFKTGGIGASEKPYCDSLRANITLKLNSEWTNYTIDLARKDMTSIIGGFCWVTNRSQNPRGCTIYLDDIQFEP